jgi:putative nucleotidyltransferase with HDIG domain
MTTTYPIWYEAEPVCASMAAGIAPRVPEAVRTGRIPDAAQGLWMVLVANHPPAAEHAERMTRLAEQLADRLGMEGEERRHLLVAARFHDVGECFLPSGLTEGSVAFSESERDAMRSHAELGADALSDAGMDSQVVDAVRAHHERWDGGGYPLGIEGSRIPRAARILHVCEAWDAMRRHRVWAELISPEEALEEIETCAGSQFDPEVARAAVECFAAERA